MPTCLARNEYLVGKKRWLAHMRDEHGIRDRRDLPTDYGPPPDHVLVDALHTAAQDLVPCVQTWARAVHTCDELCVQLAAYTDTDPPDVAAAQVAQCQAAVDTAKRTQIALFTDIVDQPAFSFDAACAQVATAKTVRTRVYAALAAATQRHEAAIAFAALQRQWVAVTQALPGYAAAAAAAIDALHAQKNNLV